MMKKLFLIFLLSFSFCLLSSLYPSSPSQYTSSTRVRIRVFKGNNPNYIFFRVVSGRYTIYTCASDSISLAQGETAVFALYNGKVAVRTRYVHGFAADSLMIRQGKDGDMFSLSTDENHHPKRVYTGDLECIPDMGSVLLINICDLESYLTGVVRAEGGTGRKPEYYKAQAVIARTYTYRNFNKHIADRYNLCDDTHCQVTGGVSDDNLITRAVNDTRDTVIATPDSNLIISAFHSNCGGETSPSEFVWPSRQDYLISVTDPYCVKSRNATWSRSFARKEWLEMLSRNGYTGRMDSTAVLDFNQPVRTEEYITGDFRLPFKIIRKEFDLKSAWFSVKALQDSVILSGRGYGHGVGLCQEGAMVMAANGSDYRSIIEFYYPGVKLLRISDAKKNDPYPVSNGN